tara:strand:+ start:124 stop:555 length:432 start_codon:yes stop_codon:yes gene_type:complete
MQLEMFEDAASNILDHESISKYCVGCGNYKDLTSFRPLVRRHGDRNTMSSTCKKCDRKAEKVKSAWRFFNPLPLDYPCPICEMTHSDYLSLGKYKTQSPFSVDHCQKTMKVRGWICNPCNSAMGLAKHNSEILNSMIRYLNER